MEGYEGKEVGVLGVGSWVFIYLFYWVFVLGYKDEEDMVFVLKYLV